MNYGELGVPLFGFGVPEARRHKTGSTPANNASRIKDHL